MSLPSSLERKESARQLTLESGRFRDGVGVGTAPVLVVRGQAEAVLDAAFQVAHRRGVSRRRKVLQRQFVAVISPRLQDVLCNDSLPFRASLIYRL